MPGNRFKHGYREILTVPDTGVIAPLMAPDVVIPVRDLLP
jgi:hypothetical protein